MRSLNTASSKSVQFPSEALLGQGQNAQYDSDQVEFLIKARLRSAGGSPLLHVVRAEEIKGREGLKGLFSSDVRPASEKPEPGRLQQGRLNIVPYHRGGHFVLFVVDLREAASSITVTYQDSYGKPLSEGERGIVNKWFETHKSTPALKLHDLQVYQQPHPDKASSAQNVWDCGPLMVDNAFKLAQAQAQAHRSSQNLKDTLSFKMPDSGSTSAQIEGIEAARLNDYKLLCIETIAKSLGLDEDFSLLAASRASLLTASTAQEVQANAWYQVGYQLAAVYPGVFPRPPGRPGAEAAQELFTSAQTAFFELVAKSFKEAFLKDPNSSVGKIFSEVFCNLGIGQNHIGQDRKFALMSRLKTPDYKAAFAREFDRLDAPFDSVRSSVEEAGAARKHGSSKVSETDSDGGTTDESISGDEGEGSELHEISGESPVSLLLQEFELLLTVEAQGGFQSVVTRAEDGPYQICISPFLEQQKEKQERLGELLHSLVVDPNKAKFVAVDESASLDQSVVDQIKVGYGRVKQEAEAAQKRDAAKAAQKPAAPVSVAVASREDIPEDAVKQAFTAAAGFQTPQLAKGEAPPPTGVSRFTHTPDAGKTAYTLDVKLNADQKGAHISVKPTDQAQAVRKDLPAELNEIAAGYFRLTHADSAAANRALQPGSLSSADQRQQYINLTHIEPQGAMEECKKAFLRYYKRVQVGDNVFVMQTGQVVDEKDAKPSAAVTASTVDPKAQAAVKAAVEGVEITETEKVKALVGVANAGPNERDAAVQGLIGLLFLGDGAVVDSESVQEAAIDRLLTLADDQMSVAALVELNRIAQGAVALHGTPVGEFSKSEVACELLSRGNPALGLQPDALGGVAFLSDPGFASSVQVVYSAQEILGCDDADKLRTLVNADFSKDEVAAKTRLAAVSGHPGSDKLSQEDFELLQGVAAQQLVNADGESRVQTLDIDTSKTGWSGFSGKITQTPRKNFEELVGFMGKPLGSDMECQHLAKIMRIDNPERLKGVDSKSLKTGLVTSRFKEKMLGKVKQLRVGSDDSLYFQGRWSLLSTKLRDKVRIALSAIASYEILSGAKEAHICMLMQGLSRGAFVTNSLIEITDKDVSDFEEAARAVFEGEWLAGYDVGLPEGVAGRSPNVHSGVGASSAQLEWMMESPQGWDDYAQDYEAVTAFRLSDDQGHDLPLAHAGAVPAPEVSSWEVGGAPQQESSPQGDSALKQGAHAWRGSPFSTKEFGSPLGVAGSEGGSVVASSGQGPSNWVPAAQKWRSASEEGPMRGSSEDSGRSALAFTVSALFQLPTVSEVLDALVEGKLVVPKPGGAGCREFAEKMRLLSGAARLSNHPQREEAKAAMIGAIADVVTHFRIGLGHSKAVKADLDKVRHKTTPSYNGKGVAQQGMSGSADILNEYRCWLDSCVAAVEEKIPDLKAKGPDVSLLKNVPISREDLKIVVDAVEGNNCVEPQQLPSHIGLDSISAECSLAESSYSF